MEKIKELIWKVIGTLNIKELRKQEQANQLRAEKLLGKAREIGKQIDGLLEK